MRYLLGAAGKRAVDYVRKYPVYLCLALVAAVTLIEANVLLRLHGHHLKALTDAARGVLEGTPHWRVYQNRLLGPWLLEMTHTVTGLNYRESFMALAAALTALANGICFFTCLDLTRDRALSVRYVFYFALLFVALQDKYWLYLWDFADMIFFLLLVYGIFRNFGAVFFICLFTAALLNREDALFICLWLVIDSFTVTAEGGRRRFRVNGAKLALGICLAAAGTAYTKFIRDRLFIVSMLPRVGMDAKNAVFGQHFKLIYNLKYIAGFRFFDKFDFITPLAATVPAAYFLFKLRLRQREMKVAALFFCMLISVLTFGRASETRVFFILIPVMLFLNLENGDKITRPLNRGAA